MKHFPVDFGRFLAFYTTFLVQKTQIHYSWVISGGGGAIATPKFDGFDDFWKPSHVQINYSYGAFVVPMSTTKLPQE